MGEKMPVNVKEQFFRDNYLFSIEDIVKSFELFIEHEKLNEYTMCSPVAHQNRIRLCEKFFDVVKKCKLPVLTELWYFYEYEFLIDSIVLELCQADEIKIENETSSTMSLTVEHKLLDIECEYLTIDQFAEMHKVDASTVNKWISRGKLRHAKKNAQKWLIPNTEDKPKRTYERVHYTVKMDEQIHSNEFPTLSMVDSIFINQDEKDKKRFVAYFKSFKTDYDCTIDLTRDEAERLELIIIESGKATVEGPIQFVPNIRDE